MSINHPDHRAAGQVVIDAIFPAAGSPFFFPDLLVKDGLEPHSVDEVWMSVTSTPNTILDVTEYWDRKIAALSEHQSQVGDPDDFVKRMRSRYNPDYNPEQPRYEEKFKRIIYK